MVKYKDVTQTGPKALKGVRNPDLYNKNNSLDSDFSPEQLQGMANTAASSKIRNYDVSHGHIGYEGLSDPSLYKPTPVSNDSGLGDYGNSMFDNGLIYNPTQEDITNQRAANEPWYAKLSAGVGKALTTTGTTFLDGTVGLLAGIGTGISRAVNGDNFTNATAALFDNPVSNGIQQINKAVEDIMPNYQSQEEKENAWYQNLGTTNFWADSFLKNLGFSVGAFYSGGAFNKVLKGIGLLNSGSTYGAKLAGSIYSAVNEGRVEANNTESDLLNLYSKQTDDAFNKRYNEIVNSGLANNQKQLALQQLSANKQKVEDDNLNRARTSGLIDLLGNTVLLGLDNYAEFGRLYSRGFNNAKGLASGLKDAETNMAKEALGDRITGKIGEYVGKKITPKQAVLSGLGKAGLEGNEEMAQQMISNFSGNLQEYDSPDAYYKALKNPNSTQKTTDFLQSLTKSFSDSYGSGDQWEQFAVGALTGLLGMPTFGSQNNADSNTYLGQNKPVGLSGGILGDISHAKATNADVDEETKTLNRMANKISNHKGHLVQSQSFSDAMNGFAADNNAFEFKNAEDNDLFVAINKFSSNGKLDDLKQLVGQDFYNMSDEELTNIASNHTPGISNPDVKTGGWRGTDGKLLTDSDEGKTLMRQELNKKKTTILQGISDYEKSLDDVKRNVKANLTDSETSELAWLDWKAKKADLRSKQIDDENKTDSNLLNIHLKSLETKNPNDKSPALQLLKDLFLDPTKKEEALKKLNTPEGKALLDSQETYNNYIAGSYIHLLGYKNMLDSMKDLSKLKDARNTFSTRLHEFIENPIKVKENRAKVDEEAAKKDVTVNKVKQYDETANSSVSQLVNKTTPYKEGMDSGIDYDSMDNFDESDIEAPTEFDDLNSNDLVTSDKETKAKVDEATKIKSTASKALVTASQIAKSYKVEPQVVQDFNTLLSHSKSVANSNDELKDTDSEAWTNPNALISNEEYSTAIKQYGEEQVNVIIKDRIDRARELANKVFGKLGDDAIEVSNMKAPKVETPVITTPINPIVKPTVTDSNEVYMPEANEKGIVKATFGTAEIGKDSNKVESVLDNKKDKVELENIAKSSDTTDSLKDDADKAAARLTPEDSLENLRPIADNLYSLLHVIKHLSNSNEVDNPKDMVNAITNTSNYQALKTTLGDNLDTYLTSKYLEFKDNSSNTTSEVDTSSNLFNHQTTLKEASNDINKLISDSSLVSDASKDAKENMYNKLVRNLHTLKYAIAEYGITNPDDIIAAVSKTTSYKELKRILGDTYDKYLIDKGSEYINNPNTKQDYEAFTNVGNTDKNTNDNALKDNTPITTSNVLDEEVKAPESINEVPTVNPTDTTSEINTDDDVIKNNESVNKNKDYWKPTTTEIPLHWEKGEPIETYYDKITKPDSNGVTLAQKRGYSKPLMQRMQAVTEHLKSTGAYDNVNTGAIKESTANDKGSTIEFYTSKALNKKAGETVILMKSNGQVVGDVASLNDPSTKGQVGLSKFIKDFESKFSKDKSNNDEYTYPDTTTVNQYLVGKVPYVADRTKDNTLNDINTADDGTQIPFSLGIALRDGAYAPYMTSGSRRGEEGRSELDKSIQSPLEAVKGQTYLLYKTGGNKKAYVTVPFNMPSYSKEINDSKIGKAIDSTITNMVNSNNTDVIKDINELENFISGKVHVNFSDIIGTNGISKNIKVEVQDLGSDDRRLIYNGAIDDNTVEAIKNGLNGMPLQISRKYINDTYNGEDYNRMIGELARTNLDKGSYHTIGNGFTIIPVGQKKASRIGTLGYNPKYTSDKVVQVQGKTERYNVDRQTYEVTDSKNRVLDINDIKTALIAAEGYGIITNQEPRSTYKTPFGLYDSSKHKMIESSPELTTEEEKSTDAVETPNTTTSEVKSMSSEEIESKAKKLGLLNSKINKTIWSKLDDDTKQSIVSKPRIIANNLMQKLKSNMTKEGNFKVDPNSLVTGRLFRESTNDNSIIDVNKEVSWLKSRLPNLSNDEHLRIVKGLIRISNSVGSKDYYGMFEKGIMTISDKAARGTIFHEAFHAVSNALLTPREHDNLITEAKKEYDVSTNLEAEETLAEEFRKYIQLNQVPVMGTIIRTFRTLKHIVNNMFGNESVIRSTFYNINKGTYGNRELHDTNDTNYSAISDRVQSVLNSIVNNPRVFSKGPKSVAALSSIDRIITSFKNQNIDVKLRYYNNKWIVASARNIDDSYDKINQYHKDKYNYNNLTQENKDYIEEKGLTLEEYRNMSNTEKEVLFKCNGF